MLFPRYHSLEGVYQFSWQSGHPVPQKSGSRGKKWPFFKLWDFLYFLRHAREVPLTVLCIKHQPWWVERSLNPFWKLDNQPPIPLYPPQLLLLPYIDPSMVLLKCGSQPEQEKACFWQLQTGFIVLWRLELIVHSPSHVLSWEEGENWRWLVSNPQFRPSQSQSHILLGTLGFGVI